MKKLLLLALLASCGPRYAARPPLPFERFPYVSLRGEPWPEKTLVVETAAVQLGLARAPRLTYVELNPDAPRSVLLIHGLGSYLKFWRHQIDELAGKGYRVVALDLPGYGKSEKPGTFPYTMEAFALVVSDVIAQLGLERPVVFGHSMGGHIAMTLALLQPDSVGGLVLTSPAGFEKFSPRERAWFEAVVRSELFIAATEEDIWNSVRAANFARWRDELEWLVEERVRVRRTPAFPAYAWANVLSVRGLTRTELTRQNLGAIAVPTIILYGSDDQLIPNPFMHGGRTRAIMEHGRAIPGARLVELRGCGHTVQLDCPVEYNAAVAAFLGTTAPAR
jgi:pimeloyl-ACP methyl ester carboxylesterase